MLTEQDCHLHAVRHEIANDLSESLVAFVLCVMPHFFNQLRSSAGLFFL
jgi:hypothetical protein